MNEGDEIKFLPLSVICFWKALEQTRPPMAMADLPDTIVYLPVTMVDLPNTMVDLPNGVRPIDNRPSTNFLNHYVNFLFKKRHDT